MATEQQQKAMKGNTGSVTQSDALDSAADRATNQQAAAIAGWQEAEDKKVRAGVAAKAKFKKGLATIKGY